MNVAAPPPPPPPAEPVITAPPAVDMPKQVAAWRCLGCDRVTVYTGRPYCGVCQSMRIGDEMI